jgi:hypothetical protein
VSWMLRRRWRFMARCRLMPHGLLLVPFHRLLLGNRHRSVGFAAHRGSRSTLHPLTDYLGHWLINRAGVRFLLAHTELGQHVDDGMRGDLKLPGQLIDSNFTHK